MNTPATPDWEKLDEEIDSFEEQVNTHGGARTSDVEAIKNTVRHMLIQSHLQYRQELEEKVEKLLKTPEVPLTSTNVLGWERKGNNTGIRRVLALLKD